MWSRPTPSEPSLSRLGEYGLQDRSYEIAAAGATLAREIVDEFVNAGWAGPIRGRVDRSRDQVRHPRPDHVCRDLVDAYEVESSGLIDGGVDLLIIETQFDLLGAKAAIEGARRAMRAAGVEIPIQVQVTIELTGRMLPGTEIGAALTTLEALRPRCHRPQLRHRPGRDVRAAAPSGPPLDQCRCRRYPTPVFPTSKTGRWHMTSVPDDLAHHLGQLRRPRLGVGVVGGCCGTSPEHLAAVIARIRPLPHLEERSRSRSHRPLRSTARSRSTRTPRS